MSLQLQASVLVQVSVPCHLWTNLFPPNNREKKSIVVGIQQDPKGNFFRKMVNFEYVSMVLVKLC